MAGDFVGWLLERGRLGGAVALFIGLGLLGLAFLELQMTGEVHVILLGIGGPALLFGVALIVLDKPSLRGEFTEPTARPPDAEVVAMLERQQKPYLLCIGCKKVVPFNPCMHCDSAVDVMTIQDDEDLKLAISSMG